MGLALRRMVCGKECARLRRGDGEDGITQAGGRYWNVGVSTSGVGAKPAGPASAVLGLDGRSIRPMSNACGCGRPCAPAAAQAGSASPTSQASGVIPQQDHASASSGHGADRLPRQVAEARAAGAADNRA